MLGDDEAVHGAAPARVGEAELEGVAGRAHRRRRVLETMAVATALDAQAALAQAVPEEAVVVRDPGPRNRGCAGIGVAHPTRTLARLAGAVACRAMAPVPSREET